MPAKATRTAATRARVAIRKQLEPKKKKRLCSQEKMIVSAPSKKRKTAEKSVSVEKGTTALKTVKLGTTKDAPEMTVGDTVSMTFTKPISLILKDGGMWPLLSEQEDKVYHRHAFNKKGSHAGVLLFRWPHLQAQALQMFTAYGDGIYTVRTEDLPKGEGIGVWVDAGSILVISDEDERKILALRGEKYESNRSIGNAWLDKKYVGTITAHTEGYLIGSHGLTLDTR